jgi:hypothetical protein
LPAIKETFLDAGYYRYDIPEIGLGILNFNSMLMSRKNV